MSSSRPTFIYSTLDDHMAAQALMKLRYSVPPKASTAIAWTRTMRTAAIVAREKIHAQAVTTQVRA